MFKGKRTYITAAIMIGAAIAQATGTTIPNEVWPILTGLGFGFLRAGIDEK